ncbi:hypothetical protein Tco_1226119 [Tanacetum coccineum]
MSAMAHATPSTAAVDNTGAKDKTPKEALAGPDASILDFCEKHYEDILPLIMERARRDKRQGLQTRLNFGESSKKSQRGRKSFRTQAKKAHRRSVHERLSDTYSPSVTRSGPSRTSSRDYHQARHRSHSRGRPRSRSRRRSTERPRGEEESYEETYFDEGPASEYYA